jgi:hypothetical protein
MFKNQAEIDLAFHALNLDGGEGSGVKGHTTEKSGGLAAAREKALAAYAKGKAKSESERDSKIAAVNAKADELKAAAGKDKSAQSRAESWRSSMVNEAHGEHESRRRALANKHSVFV